MNILLTGATGFIGGHLLRRLRSMGHNVRCLVRSRAKAQPLESLGARIVIGDLSTSTEWKTALTDTDAVYHLAGVTRTRSDREYYTGNQIATRHLVDACLQVGHRLQRFVHVSSLAAVGPSVGGDPLTEDASFHPVSDYGRSKMLGEVEARRLSSRVPVTILRPSAVYGPHERDLLEYFKLIGRGVQLLIGFGRKLLNLIYADDLVDGIILAGESPRAIGETYFLGSGRDYTTEEIGSTIADAVGRRPVRLHVPHTIVLLAGAVAEVYGRLTDRQIFFNIQKAREAVQPCWSCSIEKARAQLGFRPRVSLVEGIWKTYDWYHMKGWL